MEKAPTWAPARVGAFNLEKAVRVFCLLCDSEIFAKVLLKLHFPPCPGVGLPDRQHRGARGLREQEEQRGEPGGRVHRARGPGRLRQIQPHVRHPGGQEGKAVV